MVCEHARVSVCYRARMHSSANDGACTFEATQQMLLANAGLRAPCSRLQHTRSEGSPKMDSRHHRCKVVQVVVGVGQLAGTSGFKVKFLRIPFGKYLPVSPDKGVAIMGAGHDHSRYRVPIDATDRQVVLFFTRGGARRRVCVDSEPRRTSRAFACSQARSHAPQ